MGWVGFGCGGMGCGWLGGWVGRERKEGRSMGVGAGVPPRAVPRQGEIKTSEREDEGMSSSGEA